MPRTVPLATLLVAACGSPSEAPAPTAGATVRMDFSRRDGFFTAPFPSDDLAGGTSVDLSRWPNPARQRYVQGLIDLAARSRGFATSAPIYLPLTAEPSALQLPSPAASVRDDAPVFVIDLDRMEPTCRWATSSS